MKGEGRPRGLAESATEIQSHRVRLSEIPSNNIPAFTFHKSDSRAGWYLHPNGPAEFSDVGRKFLFGQIKTQSDVLGLQGDEKLEVGWGRQRKLQGEGGKRKKRTVRSRDAEKKVERQIQELVGQHVGSLGNKGRLCKRHSILKWPFWRGGEKSM